MPIDQVKLPVSVERSRAFYTVALAPFGYKLVYAGATWRCARGRLPLIITVAAFRD